MFITPNICKRCRSRLAASWVLSIIPDKVLFSTKKYRYFSFLISPQKPTGMLWVLIRSASARFSYNLESINNFSCYVNCMCVCLFVQRFYGPVNPMESCRAWSVYLTTRLLGRLIPLTSIVHILSPETDNCPSWISRRERMRVENISWSISTKECWLPRRGLNPRPSGLQSDGASNWATEAGAVCVWVFVCVFFFFFLLFAINQHFHLKNFT